MPSNYPELVFSRDEDFDEKRLNAAMDVIDQRLRALEPFSPQWEEAVNELRMFGLSRIDEAIVPTLERVQNLSELGFLVAQSDTSLVLTENVDAVFFVQEGPQRDLFTPAPFLVATRQANWTDYAVLQLKTYDKTDGRLTVTVKVVHGAAGPFNDWWIGALAGNALAAMTYMTRVEAARDIVLAAKTIVLANSSQIATDKDQINSLVDQANAAKAAAEAAAASASAFDPALFTKKTVALPNATNLNNIVESGFYRLGSSLLNAPGSGVELGQMIVSRGSDTVMQIVTGPIDSRFFMRQGSGIGGTPLWQPWFEVAGNATTVGNSVLKAADAAAARSAIGAVNKAGDTGLGDMSMNAITSVTGSITINGWGGVTETGTLFFGATGTRYLQYGNGSYSFSGAHVYSAAGRLWGSNDFNYTPVNKAGDTISGSLNVNSHLNVNYGAANIGGVNVGGITVEQSGDACISFHSVGAFGVNFGLRPDGRLYVGGWSLGAAAYRIWTTQDFTQTPVNMARLVFAGDGPATNGVFQEPYSGAVVTGLQENSGFTVTIRWRYLQLAVAGVWYNIGYA